MQLFNNKFTKKLLCTVLACGMIMSFSACGDREDVNDPSSSQSSSSSSSQVSKPVKEDNKDKNKDKSDKDKSSSESEKDNSSSEKSDSKEPKTVKEKIKEAKSVNSDTVGWITIPNTKIDNEILQTGDNEFYLRRDITKNYNWYGCYFADYECKIKDKASLSPNTVIYGHNMEDRPNGKKFAQLFNYLNEDFAKNNPYIYIDTEEGRMVFQVFAVYFTETAFNYVYVDPVKDSKKYGTNDTIQSIIDEAKLRSEMIYDVDVNGNDKLLTLSTCTYKYGGEKNEEQRFVVQARLLRDGETEQKTVSVKKNPSPKEPKFSKEYK